jgi:predicted nucleic acid-binding protein
VIHLDTNVLIEALVPGSEADQALRRWLLAGENLGISSIAWAEFLCGPVGAAEVDVVSAMFREITPYTVADAEITARLFNLGGRRRGTLADCMIAAVAIRASAPLATANPSDFERFAAEALTIVAA